MAVSLLKGSAKIAIGVGAVYVSVSQGVWNSSNQGSKALQKVRTSVLPEATTYVEQVPKIQQNISLTAVDYWNTGVGKVFSGMAKAPSTAASLTSKAYQQLKDSMK